MAPCPSSSPTSLRRSRRRTGVLVVLIMSGLFALSVLGAEQDRPKDRFRGGKVEWTRLKHDGHYWNRHAKSDDALRLLYAGDRVIGLLSLSGMQCVWSGIGHDEVSSMEMVTNIYLYAITR